MIDPLMEIDWNWVWRGQMERSRESGPGRDCARIWESRESALRFWDMCQRERRRIDEAIWEMYISEGSRILDIGAGPGTLAIPLSMRAEHVTAVEPADGMCRVMQEKIEEFGAENITIVQKRWEDVSLEEDLQMPYDVVIASFSLGMKDIRAAIEKMVQASSMYIYLYHFAGPTSWDLQWKRLWPRLHGREYQPGPKCDVLYNVLYQMGIYPHIRAFRLEHGQRYTSLEAALEEIASQARAETDDQRAILREYLQSAGRVEDGAFLLPGSSIRVKIWWRKGELTVQ